MNIFFLSGATPFTKSFSLDADGKVQKTAYPNLFSLTSHQEHVTSVLSLYDTIKHHAAQGHCMLKGVLTRPLVNESRRSSHNRDDETQWICLDFDRHESKDVDLELQKLGLGDVSYVLQYSASHGMPGTEGTLSAHVFMLLEKSRPAPLLKEWLREKNLTIFLDQLRLSKAKFTISWPLDISTCQNDKLLFIAPPVFGAGVKDPLKERIFLIKKKLERVPHSRTESKTPGALANDERKVLNELRRAEGLPARTAKTSVVGTREVLNKPDQCVVTGVKADENYVRLNLNGGDSWAYYHTHEDIEWVYSFKDDVWMRTKELVPNYYQKLVELQRERNATPTETGDLILAFRDLRTSTYWNGMWNPQQEKLTLYPARNERMLEDWMRSHGRTIGDYIPVWEMMYDPRVDWVIDEDNHYINMFQKSSYMRMTPKVSSKGKFPAIEFIIKNMLGIGPEDAEGIYDAFINWLAVIVQRKGKPTVSWIAHGTEGTGKGYFVNKIMTPLLGVSNVHQALVKDLEDPFNGWLEKKLFVFVDEVDVDDFKDKGRVAATLRNYITEPVVPVRHMRQQSTLVPNYASFLFSSNRPQPVFIPQGDRRYNVGNFQDRKLPRPDDAVVEKELAAFAQFLLAHKADIEEANKIVDTAARRNIQNLGLTSIVETCAAIKNGDFESLWFSRPHEQAIDEATAIDRWTVNAVQYTTLLKSIAKDNFRNRLTRDEIQVILEFHVGNIPRNANKLTSLLRHNGINTTRMRIKGQLVYGFEVTWKLSKDVRADVEEHIAPPAETVQLKAVKGGKG